MHQTAIGPTPVFPPGLSDICERNTSGYLPQLVVDLNQYAPTIFEYLPDTPIYAPDGRFYQTCHTNLLTISGRTFRDGLIGFARSFGIKFLHRTEQRISIRSVDPATKRSTAFLKRYFGSQFNCMNDFVV
jgi:hypothetical protein